MDLVAESIKNREKSSDYLIKSLGANKPGKYPDPDGDLLKCVLVTHKANSKDLFAAIGPSDTARLIKHLKDLKAGGFNQGKGTRHPIDEYPHSEIHKLVSDFKLYQLLRNIKDASDWGDYSSAIARDLFRNSTFEPLLPDRDKERYISPMGILAYEIHINNYLSISIEDLTLHVAEDSILGFIARWRLHVGK